MAYFCLIYSTSAKDCWIETASHAVLMYAIIRQGICDRSSSCKFYCPSIIKFFTQSMLSYTSFSQISSYHSNALFPFSPLVIVNKSNHMFMILHSLLFWFFPSPPYSHFSLDPETLLPFDFRFNLHLLLCSPDSVLQSLF